MNYDVEQLVAKVNSRTEHNAYMRFCRSMLTRKTARNYPDLLEATRVTNTEQDMYNHSTGLNRQECGDIAADARLVMRLCYDW